MLAQETLEPGQLPVSPRAVLLSKIREGRLAVPVLPAVAHRLLSLAARDDCDLGQLADIVGSDPTVAGRLLEVANSAALRARSKITSLHHAVNRLGATTFRQVALAISCKSAAFTARGAEPILREVFRHSVATALCAQAVARVRGVAQEEAFLYGLLHDVGRPVLLQAISKVHRQSIRVPLHRSVSSFIDEQHTIVGAQLARRWQLSLRAQGAIRWHHAAASGGQRDAPSTVAFAEALVRVFFEEVDERTLGEELSLCALALEPADLARILGKREAIVETVEAFA